jgi:hypothetical protein
MGVSQSSQYVSNYKPGAVPAREMRLGKLQRIGFNGSIDGAVDQFSGRRAGTPFPRKSSRISLPAMPFGNRGKRLIQDKNA